MMNFKKCATVAVCAVTMMGAVNFSSMVALAEAPQPLKIENTGNSALEKILNLEIEKNNKNKVDEENKIEITTTYEEKFRNDKILSFVITTEETAASTGITKLYYNSNLETGKTLTLKELLGDNFKAVADKSIQEQIKQRMATDENQIFFGFSQDDKDMGIDGFTGISDDQTFYINKEGHVVITFEQFSIAPGYMGTPEFEIVNK